MYHNQLQEASRALGINPNNLTFVDPSMRDKAIKNPNFMTFKQTILNNSPPPETVDILEGFAVENEANKDNIISMLENKYNYLTNQLKQIQNDEKNAWKNLNTAKDPNFIEKKEGYLIKQKLDKLKRERDLVFNELTSQYNHITQHKTDVLQLSNRNEYVMNLQNEINNDNKNKLIAIDQDILTRRRQAQINMNQYYRQNNKVFFLKTFFVFTLIAMIPIILGLLGFLNKSIASTIMLVIYVILALIFMIKVIDNSNRSKLLWQERVFINQGGLDSEDSDNCPSSDSRNRDTCEISKYGCCPDGVTSKQYENDDCNMTTEMEEETNNLYQSSNESHNNLFF